MVTKYHTKVKYNKHKLMLLPDVFYIIKKTHFQTYSSITKPILHMNIDKLLHASYNTNHRFCCN